MTPEAGRRLGARRGTVWVVGDAPTVRGFRLAGLEGRVVTSAGEAREALEALRSDGAVLVLLTEDVARALGGAEVAMAQQPLVAVIPSVQNPSVETAAAARLSQAVRRALGLARGPRS